MAQQIEKSASLEASAVADWRHLGREAIRTAGRYTLKTIALPRGLLPLAALFRHNESIDQAQLARALDALFVHLYEHPVTRQTRGITRFLRENSILPNEASTEELIRFVVNQCVVRSPVPVPDLILEEFWSFYDELWSVPEMRGLAELNLDVTRYVLRVYEPLLVELINLLKQARRVNQELIGEMLGRMTVVRGDIKIIRRQIKALRYIAPFFRTDPKDFAGQARIVADMVSEFGPFFIKMAQVAASNADFLPAEIAAELAVFHEDVDAMKQAEVLEAFRESFGKSPHEMYFGFDTHRPLKSGSIGSVYLARRPVREQGREVLREVVVKVGRHNLDREFQMGKMVLGLAIISSEYWAPHSKLAPFLKALQEQVDEFVLGFQQELDFTDEAAIQARFARRAARGRHWSVPKVYRASSRVMEMEYLDGAQSLTQVVAGLSGRKGRRRQRSIARRFLYSVLEQIVVFNEFHGDLHPGNVLIDRNDHLWLIDWGNTVDLRGRWLPVREYLAGVLLGDIERLADALIAISTLPEANRRRRGELVSALEETLRRKSVFKIGRGSLRPVMREGVAGLHRRIQAIGQLMSNTQQLGIVVRGDYMHLSRSVAAAAGSWASLYQGLPRWMLFSDLLAGLARFPADLTVERLRGPLEIPFDALLAEAELPPARSVVAGQLPIIDQASAEE